MNLRHAFIPSLIAAACLAAAAPACAPGRANPSMHLDYTVTPEPGRGFEVVLRVEGLAGRRPGFRLLDGWGMLQDQAGHVSGLSAVDDRGGDVPLTREDEDAVALWRLRRNPGAVTVRYRVDPYPAALSAEASFVDRKHLVLVGYSVFLIPTGLDHYDPVDASVRVRAPAGWRLWSSWPGSEPEFHPPTPHDIWSGMVAGGDFTPARLWRGPVSVTVLTEAPDPGRNGLSIANRLLPVLRGMFSLFGAPPRGDSLNVVALYRTMPAPPGRSVMSGSSEEGAFLALATPDRFRNPVGLTQLAAHECLHFYLGGAVTGDPEPPYRNSPELIWLMEGMTEYVSRRLMAQAGVIQPADLEATTLDKDREYRSTPGWRTTTLAEAARRMEDPETYQLVYSRGYLVARLLEERMDARCGPGTLDRALRRLFEEHDFYRTRAAIRPREARRLFDEVCPGTGELLDRYARGSAPLPEPAGAAPAVSAATGRPASAVPRSWP